MPLFKAKAFQYFPGLFKMLIKTGIYGMKGKPEYLSLVKIDLLISFKFELLICLFLIYKNDTVFILFPFQDSVPVPEHIFPQIRVVFQIHFFIPAYIFFSNLYMI